MTDGHFPDQPGADQPVDDDPSVGNDELTPDNDQPVRDWRNGVGTVGLVVGNVMIGLEKVIFPEKRKADTEQVSDVPIDPNAPRLDYGDSGLEPLGPDDDGYWPT